MALIAARLSENDICVECGSCRSALMMSTSKFVSKEKEESGIV